MDHDLAGPNLMGAQMKVRTLLTALVAMVATTWYTAAPASAGQPAPAATDAAVVHLSRSVTKSQPASGDVGIQVVYSQKFCASANVFDTACIQAFSTNNVTWTGIRGTYELGLSRPATACFSLNVGLVSNRGSVGAAPGQVCFGRPLIRDFNNLPLFGGYCAQVGFQDQQLGYIFWTPFLCFN
jgi:hypothetical protein